MGLKCSGDPGNRVTVLCLCEAALTMLTCDQLPVVAGFLTPATGLGEAYFKRLQQAGFSTEITPLSESKENDTMNSSRWMPLLYLSLTAPLGSQRLAQAVARPCKWLIPTSLRNNWTT